MQYRRLFRFQLKDEGVFYSVFFRLDPSIFCSATEYRSWREDGVFTVFFDETQKYTETAAAARPVCLTTCNMSCYAGDIPVLPRRRHFEEIGRVVGEQGR